MNSTESALRQSLEQAIEALRCGDPTARTNALRDCPAALAQPTAEPPADKARLDSGCITMHGRDEFGEPSSTLHVGVNLRAAIDEAMAYEAECGRAAAPALLPAPADVRALIKKLDRLIEWCEASSKAGRNAGGWQPTITRDDFKTMRAALAALGATCPASHEKPT